MGRRRQEFAGLGELDVGLLQQATRNYVGRQKLFLHKMLASAVWTAARKQHAALTEEDECPHCGAADCTPEHLWWSCSAFEEQRGDKEIVR
eukprot:9955009-Alexandrium_andersonii.AAC.1